MNKNVKNYFLVIIIFVKRFVMKENVNLVLLHNKLLVIVEKLLKKFHVVLNSVVKNNVINY